MSGSLVWFTGLPASGKSTLAMDVRRRLAGRGVPACVLDSDEVRAALLPDLGYSAEERDRFYATLVNLGALLCRQDLVVLVAATAPLAVYRGRARDEVEHFVEVHVATPLPTCKERDPKGLYARAQRGELSALPGVGAAYEAPQHPELTALGGHDRAAAAAVVEAVVARRRAGDRVSAGDAGRELDAVQSALDQAMTAYQRVAPPSRPPALDLVGVFLRAAASSLQRYRGR